MQESLPPSVASFQQKHAAIWDAFAELGEKCHESGPLEEKTRRLVKLAMAVAFRHEGAVHSAVRNALRSGVSREEIEHVAILGITTIGWPATNAAITWIEDAFSRDAERPAE